MKFFLTFSFIFAISYHCFSQKWSNWENDTTYSIIGKKRVHSKRKKLNSQQNIYQEVWLYFDQCSNLELKTTALFKAGFVPKYIKYKSKKYKSKCVIKIDTLFPKITNENINYLINNEDSTITVINNTDSTISVSLNNEWDYKKKGFSIGKLPPNSEKTFKIPKFISSESQFQLIFFEAYRGNILLRRG